MDRRTTIELADLNLAEFCRRTALRSPGQVEERDGLLCWAAPHPSRILANGAIRTDATLPADDAMRLAASFFSEIRHGYAFWTAAHADPDLDEACSTSGFDAIIDLVGRVIDERVAEPHALDLTIERVDDERTLADFVEVTAEAYGEDDPDEREMVAAIFAELQSLATADSFAAVGYADGAPVTAGMTTLSHDVAFIGWIGTRQDARERGYGDAITRTVTNAGFDLGARFASLQASPDGDGIYARMGYREIASYKLWGAPAPE